MRLPTSVLLADRSRGSVLIASLSISLMLAMATAVLVSNAVHRYAAERGRAEQELAFHVAESGIEVACYELEVAADTAADGIGIASATLSGGRYQVTVAPAYAGAGSYTLTSVGTVGQRSRTVQRGVTISGGSAIGMVGLDSISISGGGSLFDSYDSSSGSYASQLSGGHAGSQARVASNGSVSTNSWGVIYGDAIPGPGGTYSGTVVVTGSTAPASELLSYATPVYSPPPGPPPPPWSGPGLLTAGTYHFSKFTVGGGKQLTFVGDVVLYVDDKFTVSGGGQLVLTPGSSLTIHHGASDFTVSGGGIVNLTQSPTTFQLFSSSTTKCSLTGGSACYAQLYCPSAAFVNSGGGDMFGSVIAKSVVISGGSRFHYDVALAGGGTPTLTVVMNRGW